jgi:(p)ppGpp synthase/HD superfamily hydrolase
MLSSSFDDALVYASRLHRTQTRKGKAVPYIAHLMVVSALVLEHGGTEEQAIAGLLHDAAEDQGGLSTLSEVEQRFGSAVAKIVADCTDSFADPKPPWRPRKEAYIASLKRKSTTSLLVSS